MNISAGKSSHRVIAFLFIVIFIATSFLHSEDVSRLPSPNLPPTHSAYDFIDRMETKGIISSIRNGTRPFTRMEIAQMLLDCSRNPICLTKVDSQQLQWLRAEFAYELKRLDPEGNYPSRKHVYRLIHDDSGLFFIPTLRIKWKFDDDNAGMNLLKLHQSHGGIIYGYISQHAAFYTAINDNLLRGDDLNISGKLSPERGDILYHTVGASRTDYFDTSSSLTFNLPFTRVVLGLERNLWGPGYTGTLGLSDHAPAYPQLKITGRYFDKITFTWLLASLDSGLIDSLRTLSTDYGFTRTYYIPKYLATHRVEISVFRGCDLGFYESVYFDDSNRGMMPLYWLPLTPLITSEQFNRDVANKQIGMDIDLNLIRNIKLYGALHIDEISLSEIFGGDNPHNWVGFQGGLFYVDPFSVRNTDFRIEYTRINPWVYSHKYIDCYHFDSVMGYWLERNSDNLFFEFRYRPLYNLQLASSYEKRRKGEEGTVADQYANASASFLFGDVARQDVFTFRCMYELLRDLQINLKYQFVTGKGLFENSEGKHDPIEQHILEFSIGYGYW